MSDRDPELTPEQEERLRRLLVDARHGDPIPVDVAARLDRVLDQLAGEGPDAVEPADEVVDLAARRRRRVAGLLVAAAAVVVLGVGVGQAVRSDDDSSGESSTAGAADASIATPEDAPAPSSTPKSNQDVQPDDEPPGSAEIGPNDGTVASMAPDGLVRLTEARFARQVVRYRDVPGYPSSDALQAGGKALADESFLCEPADWGEGTLLPVLYDGLPAVLAYRPPAGTTQTVELLRCGTAEVLRSTVLGQD